MPHQPYRLHRSHTATCAHCRLSSCSPWIMSLSLLSQNEPQMAACRKCCLNGWPPQQIYMIVLYVKGVVGSKWCPWNRTSAAMDLAFYWTGVMLNPSGRRTNVSKVCLPCNDPCVASLHRRPPSVSTEYWPQSVPHYPFVSFIIMYCCCFFKTGSSNSFVNLASPQGGTLLRYLGTPHRLNALDRHTHTPHLSLS